MDEKPKEAKKPKTVMFAVDTNDEMIHNKLKDSTIVKIKNESNCDGCILWIELKIGQEL